MKKIVTMILLTVVTGFLLAQEIAPSDMVKNGFTIKLAINIPSDDYGIIPEDTYLEPHNTRPGFGMEFGRMWFFNKINLGDMTLGLDATFLSLNYNVIKGENKVEAVSGQMIYKYDYRHISVSTIIGPSLTYKWNNDLATDLAIKVAPTLNYFYYQHSVDNEYYKNPNIQMGIALKFHPSVNLRYKQYLFGVEYSYGSANYTDFRDSYNAGNVQTNDLIISLNMLKIILGFKL